MAYTVNLSGNQQLMIVNQGTQTLITSISSSPGQQQSQSSSVNTGNWITPPQLYKTASGLILYINGELAQQYVLVQANSISTIASPRLDNAVQINLENIPDTTASVDEIKFEPMQRMKPMPPMEPMQMGNMSMNTNPMSMRMGNMSMTMGKMSKNTSTKQFCSQCGAKVKSSDLFCSSCGNKLDN